MLVVGVMVESLAKQCLWLITLKQYKSSFEKFFLCASYSSRGFLFEIWTPGLLNYKSLPMDVKMKQTKKCAPKKSQKKGIKRHNKEIVENIPEPPAKAPRLSHQLDNENITANDLKSMKYDIDDTFRCMNVQHKQVTDVYNIKNTMNDDKQHQSCSDACVSDLRDAVRYGFIFSSKKLRKVKCVQFKLHSISRLRWRFDQTRY